MFLLKHEADRLLHGIDQFTTHCIVELHHAALHVSWSERRSTGGLRAIEEEWAWSIGTCVSLICGGMSPACGATEHTHVYGVLNTFTFTNTFIHRYRLWTYNTIQFTYIYVCIIFHFAHSALCTLHYSFTHSFNALHHSITLKERCHKRKLSDCFSIKWWSLSLLPAKSSSEREREKCYLSVSILDIWPARLPSAQLTLSIQTAWFLSSFFWSLPGGRERGISSFWI